MTASEEMQETRGLKADKGDWRDYDFDGLARGTMVGD